MAYGESEGKAHNEQRGAYRPCARRTPPRYQPATLDLVGDPCVIVLRRGGGAIVARFTRNVDPQEIRRAAEEDSAEEQRSAFVHPGP